MFTLKDTQVPVASLDSDSPPQVPTSAETQAEPLLRSIEWSELYRTDFEYERFYEWLDRRNDPLRPDRMALLGEIPLHFGPAEIPPPLRRHFVEEFNDANA